MCPLAGAPSTGLAHDREALVPLLRELEVTRVASDRDGLSTYHLIGATTGRQRRTWRTAHRDRLVAVRHNAAQDCRFKPSARSSVAVQHTVASSLYLAIDRPSTFRLLSWKYRGGEDPR